MIMRGLISWTFSQGKPMRSSAPGAKFSTSTSHSLIRRTRISLPFGSLVVMVIERLLWFSMVKYRLSTSGMSRSWPRVASPSPALSTLITSAPIQASSWVQVGPDCTWVKSRILTPSSALLILFPLQVSNSRNSFLLRRARVQAGDPAAFRSSGFVDDRVDQCRLARGHGFFQRLGQFLRSRGPHADAAEGLHHHLVAGVLDELGGRHVAAGGVLVGALVDAVVVEDHDADRQVVAADRLDFHAAETEGAVALDGNYRLAARHRRGDGIAHADAHDAPGAHAQALARLVHVHDAAREIERVGTFVHEVCVGTRLDRIADHVQCALEIHRRRVLVQRLRHLREVLVLALGDGAGPVRRRLGPAGAHA